MALTTVRLNKGDSPNWGFRLQGGKDFGTPLVIQKVNGGSPAERAGLIAGDAVVRINNTDVYNLMHKEAQDVIVRAGNSFDMTIQRGGTATWKPSVTPVGSFNRPTPSINNASPVTKTSLAAKPTESIGSIGTGHNLSAKPFSPLVNGTVNGGPNVVNKQYNSPIKLYSEETIAETLSAQTEVLPTGALGVNFKKNEKNYDATNSAVYRMLQEAENEPRTPTNEVLSTDYYSHHSHAIGGRKTVSPRPTTPSSSDPNRTGSQRAESPKPKPPEGATICTDCERVIVGVFVRIKDKNLHVECFKCSTCGTSLKNVGYYNINNKLYCDVHAKAAARSNPPSVNASPYTAPPPGAPANAISAALNTHSLLSSSPKQSSSPYQSAPNYSTAPKPFSSVSAPLSPSSTLPRSAPLSPQRAPLSPQRNLSPGGPAPAPTFGTYSPASSTEHNVESVVWPPPVHEEPELPTACPLFYPPPSKVEASLIHKRHRDKTESETLDEESSEIQEINAMAESQIYYSQEVDFSKRKCSVEILSETLETQKFVENVMHSFPQGAPPLSGHFQIANPIEKSEKHDCVSSCPLTRLDSECCRKKERCDLKLPTQYSPNTIECQLPPKITNPVPQKWESPLTQALRTTAPDPDTFAQIPSRQSHSSLASALSIAPDKPFSPTVYSNEPVPLPQETEPYFPPERSVIHEHEEEVRPQKEKQSQTQTPKPESPFVQALKIAPDRPFSPAGGTPPPVKKKPKDPTAKYFEDLPKPQEKLTMRTALTTASDRPYSPLAIEPCGLAKSEELEKKGSKAGIDRSLLTKPLKPDVLPASFQMNQKVPKPPSYYPPQVLYEATKETKTEEIKEETESKQVTVTETKTINPGSTAQVVVGSELQEPSTNFAPQFQGFACYYKNKADNTLFSVEISTTPPIPATPPPKPISYIATVQEKPSYITTQRISEEKRASEQSTKKQEQFKEEIKVSEIQKQAEEVIKVKPAPVTTMLHKPEALPQYQVNLQESAEADLKLMERVEKSQARHKKQQEEFKKEMAENVHYEQRSQMRTQEAMSQQQRTTETLTKPVITIEPGNSANMQPHSAFKPVIDDRPPSSTFSPRPRPLTPSMISKPPPVLPYYQANLVAQEYSAPITNLLDPKSPAISRSPSPCPDKQRSLSPFPCKAREERAKSPAAGPPANPLQSSHPLPNPESSRVEVAKQNLQAFIPEYKSKRDLVEQTQGVDFYKRREEMHSSSAENQRFEAYSSQVESEVRPCQMKQTTIQKAESGFVSDKDNQKICQRQSMQMQNQKMHEKYTKSLGDGSMQTSVTARSQQQNLEALSKSELHSMETTPDGLTQIQRKKTVVEEYEQLHKEETIQIESNISYTTEHPFRRVNVPEQEPPAVKSHVTNPQQITSPFLSSRGSCDATCQKACAKTSNIQQTCTEVCKTACSNVDSQQSHSETQPQTTPIPAPPPHPAIKPVFAPPTPIQHVSAPGSSKKPPQSLTRPNIPNPDSGAGTGRQAGGISVTPKRGRGVLNASSIGGRIPLCAQCHGQIRGPFITALGKIWCPQHFICATPSCRRQLQDLGFVEEKGQLYCEYCFEQYLAPPCSKCSGKIKGDCLKAIGKNFHPECFNCSYCGKLFGNSPFFLEDGSPYCEADWNELFTTKCFACGFPVEAGDRWVEALNNNYHSQCFNCTMCKKNLEGQSFFAKGGRPFCKNHAR